MSRRRVLQQTSAPGAASLLGCESRYRVEVLTSLPYNRGRQANPRRYTAFSPYCACTRRE